MAGILCVKWEAGERIGMILISVEGIDFVVCLCLWYLLTVVSAANILSCSME